MSAGRKRANLAELQAVADDGYSSAVRKFLLGEDAPVRPVEVEPVRLSPEDVLLSADVDREHFRMPADWQFRTTRGDLRRMVADAAKRRLPEADEPLVEQAMFGRKLPQGLRSTKEDRKRVALMLRACLREQFAEIPPGPVREPKLARMPTRTSHDGECSGVVRRFRDGRVMVGGVFVTEEVAQDTLRTIGAR